MIHLKGLTTAGAYDNQGKYLEEIHEDIEKIMKRLILQFDIYINFIFPVISRQLLINQSL